MTEGTGWRLAYDKVRDDLSLNDDCIGLFALNLRFGLNDFAVAASESITGGDDDKKADIVHIDRERNFAVIAQCYVSKQERQAAPSNKAADLNTAVSWLLTRDITDLPIGLQGPATDLRSAIEDKDINQIFVWYVHNLPESKNVSDELSTVEKSTSQLLSSLDNGSNVNVFSSEIGTGELERLYNLAERTIVVTDKFETIVPGVIQISEGDWSSLTTAVKASWLYDMFKLHGSDLFSANLRGYLGSKASETNINYGIKQTAEKEPKNFFVYNNGVTAIVLDYKATPTAESSLLDLVVEGVSIVNGAQTTGSISSLGARPTDDVLVPIRFVKSIKEPILNNIVRFNNSQNRLQAADFRSTDAIQQRLRSEFSKIPSAEYEGGRRGGASDAMKRSRHTLPSYTVGQALTAFHGEPVTAYNKKSEIWTLEKNYRFVFTERTTASHIVFCYSLLSSINQTKNTLQAKHKDQAVTLTEREIRNLQFLDLKGASYLLVYCISQAIETIIGRAVANRFDLQFKGNPSPATAEDSWSPIVNSFLALSNQLEPAFTSGRISNDHVRTTVQTVTGLIDSLSDSYEPQFAAFRKKVTLSIPK